PRINLMSRNKIPRAEPTAQEIFGNGVSERQWGRGFFRAKNDHVCEVGPDLGRGFFAVETAGGKDGFYGSDGEGGWVEGDVAGVVLLILVSKLGTWCFIYGGETVQ